MNHADQDHESAKDRALRIPLDYCRRMDAVGQWKIACAMAAILITGGYAGWLVYGTTGPQSFSHGPVARAHAYFERDCTACHLNYVAIREDAANPLARFGLLSSDKSPRTAAQIRQSVDHKCQVCHAGPPHHENEKQSDARMCASCHLDHQGRGAPIARPLDKHCTRCHGEMAGHREGASKFSPAIADVSVFAADAGSASQALHPEFRSLEADPGNLKFNHAMHMTAGIPAADAKGQGTKLMSLADLPADAISKYRRSDQPAGNRPDREYAIQLECRSCHQTQADSTTAGFKSDSQRSIPSSGEYMLPVNFERHCRACHPLNFEPTPSREMPHEPTPSREMTHGLKPAAMREFLLGRYSFESRSGRLDDSTRQAPRRAIPGRSTDNVVANNLMKVDHQVAKAERYLQETTNVCGKCHSFSSADSNASSLLREVEPVNVPQVWFKHARFDHAAHREVVSCKQCHAQAYPTGATQADGQANETGAPPLGPQDQETVMIAGKEVCMKCHSERSTQNPAGGARYDCVECHRYHSPTGTHR